MNRPTALERTLHTARQGRLYPAVILHGADSAGRRAAATEIGRALLCERQAEARPCGSCRQCERIATPEAPPGEKDTRPFHPDFAIVWRDAKTVTSADAVRAFLRAAYSTPFEARGQVFVVAEADTLSPEAGDALLKLLEEPGMRAPRHFLLLAPSRLDLVATLRSRSQAVYLGAASRVDAAQITDLARRFGVAHAKWRSEANPLLLLEAATQLAKGAKFDDPRAAAPWSAAAGAVKEAAYAEALERAERRRLIALAEDLLVIAPALRLRGIRADRILEGLVSRHLAG